jgi:hypothetical protein
MPIFDSSRHSPLEPPVALRSPGTAARMRLAWILSAVLKRGGATHGPKASTAIASICRCFRQANAASVVVRGGHLRHSMMGAFEHFIPKVKIAIDRGARRQVFGKSPPLQPVERICITPFTTSRMATVRLPPRFAGGISGSTSAHSSSVRSLLRSYKLRFSSVHSVPPGESARRQGITTDSTHSRCFRTDT